MYPGEYIHGRLKVPRNDAWTPELSRAPRESIFDRISNFGNDTSNEKWFGTQGLLVSLVIFAPSCYTTNNFVTILGRLYEYKHLYNKIPEAHSWFWKYYPSIPDNNSWFSKYSSLSIFSLQQLINPDIPKLQRERLKVKQ